MALWPPLKLHEPSWQLVVMPTFFRLRCLLFSGLWGMLLWVSACRTLDPAPDKLLQLLLCYQGKGLPRAGKSGGAGEVLEVLDRRAQARDPAAYLVGAGPY